MLKFEKSCGAVVYTFIDKEIKYLLVQNLEGVYGFPKGHMELNETEEETALREIKEEVGLNVELIDGFKEEETYLTIKKQKALKTVIYFLAHYKNQEFKYQREELSNAVLVDFDTAINLFNHENKKTILTKANEFLQKNNSMLE